MIELFSGDWAPNKFKEYLWKMKRYPAPKKIKYCGIQLKIIMQRKIWTILKRRLNQLKPAQFTQMLELLDKNIKQLFYYNCIQPVQ